MLHALNCSTRNDARTPFHPAGSPRIPPSGARCRIVGAITRHAIPGRATVPFRPRICGHSRREFTPFPRTGRANRGMSTRAIGTALGVSDGTVRNDSGAQDYAPESVPHPVTGLDGKTYEPIKRERGAAEVIDAEVVEDSESTCGAHRGHRKPADTRKRPGEADLTGASALGPSGALRSRLGRPPERARSLPPSRWAPPRSPYRDRGRR